MPGYVNIGDAAFAKIPKNLPNNLIKQITAVLLKYNLLETTNFPRYSERISN